MHGTYSVK
jgi:hypothetical protein